MMRKKINAEYIHNLGRIMLLNMKHVFANESV